MKAIKQNYFAIGVVVALIAGFFSGAAAESLNPSGWTTRIAVIVLFLITGMTLKTQRILHDLSNPKLHIFLQFFIFIVFPLYFLTSIPLFGHLLDGRLTVGFLALAVLPTTIGSCTVFTHMAHGNTTAAVFNSAVANVAGIFLSPLLLSLLLSGVTRAMPAGNLAATLQNLALGMFLPIVVGQLLRLRLSKTIEEHRGFLGNVMSSLIMVIVFFAFARASDHPDFLNTLRSMPWPLLYLALSHVLLIALAYGVALFLRLSPTDRIAVVFVAPQKTLAMGAPMLSLYFEDPNILGIALLPLIFYHPFQLLVASIMKSLPFIRRLQHASVA